MAHKHKYDNSEMKIDIDEIKQGNAETEIEEPIVEEILSDETETKDAAPDELAQKLEEEQDRYMRLYADFENYKKRTAKEKADIYTYASAGVIEKLLSVLDSFEIALKNKTEENEAVYEGIEKISKQLTDVLESEGLSTIPCVGECFDPNCHHAVATDAKGDCNEDIITEEFMRGYKYKDKVLRPSMVKVNKK